MKGTLFNWLGIFVGFFVEILGQNFLEALAGVLAYDPSDPQQGPWPGQSLITIETCGIFKIFWRLAKPKYEL